MKLSECKIGVVVTGASVNLNFIGHIVDLTYNTHGEIIPVVRYPVREPQESFTYAQHGVHYNNLKLYED
jgi:hypothetical protein